MRVLLIEDNPGDAVLIQQMLRQASSGTDFELVHEETLTSGIQQLRIATFDAILLDLGLPDSPGGLQTLVQLQAETQTQAAILVLTGINDEELGRQAIEHGAQDFVGKGEITGPFLVRAIRYARERVLAEENLRNQQSELHSLLESISDGFFALDPEMRVVYFNSAAERLLKMPADQVLGKAIFDAFPDARGTLFQEKYAYAIRNQVALTFETYYDAPPLRDWFDVRVYPRNGGISVFFLVTTMERKTAEDLVRLGTAIDQAGECIVITDPQGTIQYVNPAFEETTGYRKEEVLGRSSNVTRSGKHTPSFYRELWETISSGHSWKGRFQNKRKDASLFWEDAIISPITDKHAQITNYVAVKRDITKEIELENQLRQAQKMEAVGMLAGGIAHDFNNLLTALQGNADLIRACLPSESEISMFVSEIDGCVQRASTLTRQLLAFSRRQVLNAKHINLNRVITNIHKFMRTTLGEHIESSLELDPAIGLVFADEGQLEQVLINLCINARDAMPEGGVLRIGSAKRHIQREDARIGLDPPTQEYIQLTVADTGIGIDPATIDHIFDPFFTTKPKDKGTGLGLSMVYGIVQQHKGFIEVESHPGNGTVFKIFLPVSAGQEADPIAQPEPAPGGGHETILLAEDDDAVRKIADRILRDAGYRLILASNGQEALELGMLHLPSLDLAVLDIVMPKRSGKEVADELKRCRADLPVLFCTGYSEDSLHHDFILNEGTLLLQKPYSPQSLLKDIRNVLDRSPRPRVKGHQG